MINELTFCELRAKEVVNAADGKKLGKITDIVFTVEGCFKGIVAPYCKKFFSFKNQEIFIPFRDIKRIGEDVILVELPQQFSSKNCISFSSSQTKQKRRENFDNVQSDSNGERQVNKNSDCDCDERCEKCMLFDCKHRWKKKEYIVCCDESRCDD